MEPEFWHARWKEGRTGFHEGKPNVFLARHDDVLGPHTTVLVPLAGKSVDMLHLAGLGHQVLGVELSEQAVTDFFNDNGLDATTTQVGAYDVWTAGPITVLVGDFFALTPDFMAGVTALYDRAAIVALPSEMRERYAAHLRALMPAGATGLVVTFDYPQDLMDGPPFAVTSAELRKLYAGLVVEEIDSAMAEAPRLRAAGVGGAVERCFKLRF